MKASGAFVFIPSIQIGLDPDPDPDADRKLILAACRASVSIL